MTGYDILTTRNIITEGIDVVRAIHVPSSGLYSYKLASDYGDVNAIYATDTQASVVASTLKSTGYILPSEEGIVTICFQDLLMNIEFTNGSTLVTTSIAKDNNYDVQKDPDAIIAFYFTPTSVDKQATKTYINFYSGYNSQSGPMHVGVLSSTGTHKLTVGGNTGAGLGGDVATVRGLVISQPNLAAAQAQIAAIQGEVINLGKKVDAIASVTTEAVARFPMR